jgi:hypothetical protein
MCFHVADRETEACATVRLADKAPCLWIIVCGKRALNP